MSETRKPSRAERREAARLVKAGKGKLYKMDKTGAQVFATSMREAHFKFNEADRLEAVAQEKHMNKIKRLAEKAAKIAQKELNAR